MSVCDFLRFRPIEAFFGGGGGDSSSSSSSPADSGLSRDSDFMSVAGSGSGIAGALGASFSGGNDSGGSSSVWDGFSGTVPTPPSRPTRDFMPVSASGGSGTVTTTFVSAPAPAAARPAPVAAPPTPPARPSTPGVIGGSPLASVGLLGTVPGGGAFGLTGPVGPATMTRGGAAAPLTAGLTPTAPWSGPATTGPATRGPAADVSALFSPTPMGPTSTFSGSAARSAPATTTFSRSPSLPDPQASTIPDARFSSTPMGPATTFSGPAVRGAGGTTSFSDAPVTSAPASIAQTRSDTRGTQTGVPFSGLFDPTPMAQRTDTIQSGPTMNDVGRFTQNYLEADRRDSIGGGESVPNAAPARSVQTSDWTAPPQDRALFGSMSSEIGRAPDPYGLNANSGTFTERGQRQSSVGPLFDLIGGAEARRQDPYNSLVFGRGAPTHANLTGMTIAEVQRYQSGMRSRGHASTAVGRYQMLSGTLSNAVRAAGIDPNTTRFTPEVQDRLATALAERRGLNDFMAGRLTADQFMDRLAREWAGLPVATAQRGHVQNVQPGQSYYQGFNQNKATVSIADARQALERMRDAPATAYASMNGQPAPPPVTVTARGPTPPSRPSDLPSRVESYIAGLPPSRPIDIAGTTLQPARPDQSPQPMENNRMTVGTIGAQTNTPQVAYARPFPDRAINTFAGTVLGGIGSAVGGGIAGPVGAIVGGLGGTWLGEQFSRGEWTPEAERAFFDRTTRGTDGGDSYDPPRGEARGDEPPPPERVEERYLLPMFSRPEEGTGLPTPFQRWVENRDTYRG